MKAFECGFNGILWLGLSIATDLRLRLDLFTTSVPSDCGFCLWEHTFILLKLTLATHESGHKRFKILDFFFLVMNIMVSSKECENSAARDLTHTQFKTMLKSLAH